MVVTPGENGPLQARQLAAQSFAIHTTPNKEWSAPRAMVLRREPSSSKRLTLSLFFLQWNGTVKMGTCYSDTASVPHSRDLTGGAGVGATSGWESRSVALRDRRGGREPLCKEADTSAGIRTRPFSELLRESAEGEKVSRSAERQEGLWKQLSSRRQPRPDQSLGGRAGPAAGGAGGCELRVATLTGGAGAGLGLWNSEQFFLTRHLWRTGSG